MDGSEIHEAVAALLAIARCGAEAVCMAPDAPQMHVVDHLAGNPSNERRNVLVESARIARGKVTDMKKIKAPDLDAVILPGGFGAAKNLCDFATSGADCSVHPEVERLLLEMHAARKPIGAICIAPAVVARVLGGRGIPVRLTIGTDAGTAEAIGAMGARHENRAVREICIDEQNRVVSTPAYMLAEGIDEAADGITLLVEQVVKMAR
jgi:enhancing lycopene biosynthesis protein 2